MDELSLFFGAPPALLRRETELLARADLVFTGGASLGSQQMSSSPWASQCTSVNSVMM
jgi:hypothetical protein